MHDLLPIPGSTTNSVVGGYGAGVGTASMAGRVSAQYLNPTLTCTFQGGGNNQVAPFLQSVSPSQGLIGNTVQVSLSGMGFGSNPTIIVPLNMTATIRGISDKQITVDLGLSNSISGGNQPIQVKNPQVTTPSNIVNFYVQIPKTLIRSPDYGNNCTPPNCGGLGPVNSITNGSVIDINGSTLLTNQCGVYQNIGYQLIDQETPAQWIYGNYDLHESFSNYSSTVSGQTVPSPLDNSITLSQTILGDTQYYGKSAPSCPGPNDHEQFDQSFSVIISGKTYPLSMVNTIQRGFYSGVGNVTITIKTR